MRIAPRMRTEAEAFVGRSAMRIARVVSRRRRGTTRAARVPRVLVVLALGVVVGAGVLWLLARETERRITVVRARALPGVGGASAGDDRDRRERNGKSRRRSTPPT